jgi:histidinol-phosphate aminotransferase
MPSKPTSYIRPLVRDLQAYVPGEQPKIPGLVKLNTNENPYPPSPKVLARVKSAVDDRLRLYPNPTCENLRSRLAALHGCRPENIIVGNGSDELLAMAVRAFVEPRVGGTYLKVRGSCLVQYFWPSYSLYPVLADIHGAGKSPVRLNPDFGIPPVRELSGGRAWDPGAALTFITTPNAPSGRGYTTSELERLCRAHKGVVILDEAYVDFAAENAMELALQFPNVLVARTFSKAYALCFQRVGYLVGHSELIAGLHKIRDSYNVNGLGQVAAEATLDDLPYYRANFRKVVEVRRVLTVSLTGLGFRVLPSETNFILAAPPVLPAQRWLQELRNRKVLVRWFDSAELRGFLRITIGTADEAKVLVDAAKAILHQAGRARVRVTV